MTRIVTADEISMKVCDARDKIAAEIRALPLPEMPA